jgi:hypothetical protein
MTDDLHSVLAPARRKKRDDSTALYDDSDTEFHDDDAECPICGFVSPGAMDCGCYQEIHCGKD